VLRYNGLVSEDQKVAKNLKEIKSNNLDLEKKIIALSLDNAIESLARERLNLIKKGEVAYKVCRSKSDRK
jgi:cell division protein FtsB